MFDRFACDEESVRNLLIRGALRDELGDPLFARREAFRSPFATAHSIELGARLQRP